MLPSDARWPKHCQNVGCDYEFRADDQYQRVRTRRYRGADGTIYGASNRLPLGAMSWIPAGAKDRPEADGKSLFVVIPDDPPRTNSRWYLDHELSLGWHSFEGIGRYFYRYGTPPKITVWQPYLCLNGFYGQLLDGRLRGVMIPRNPMRFWKKGMPCVKCGTPLSSGDHVPFCGVHWVEARIQAAEEHHAMLPNLHNALHYFRHEAK